jgi:hypothetical protein
MPEGTTDPVIEERDGHFYINGNEVTEEAAKLAAGGSLPGEDPLEDEHADQASNGVVPDSNFERLQKQYADSEEEKRKTILIAPGRFESNLGVRCKKGPWKDYRKRAEKLFDRGGGGTEAELRFAATTFVTCCETILYRPTDDGGLLPLHECRGAWKNGDPIGFDARLAEALGIELTGAESASEICRLVFKNPAALNDAFTTLDAWLKDAIPSDGEEEDEEGEVDRPT